MLNPDSNIKIYLCCPITDMRKGINGLSILASQTISQNKNTAISTGAMFVFKGKRSESGKPASSLKLAPIRTQHAAFTALRSSISKANVI